MKKRNLIYVTCMLIAMGACSATSKNQAEVVTDTWGKYNVALSCLKIKHRKRKVLMSITGLFPMRNRISRPRHVRYWLPFIILRMIVFRQ